MRRGLWMIFRWPLALAVLSTFGLLSALLGDGVSTCCRGFPLVFRCC